MLPLPSWPPPALPCQPLLAINHSKSACAVCAWMHSTAGAHTFHIIRTCRHVCISILTYNQTPPQTHANSPGKRKLAMDLMRLAVKNTPEAQALAQLQKEVVLLICLRSCSSESCSFSPGTPLVAHTMVVVVVVVFSFMLLLVLLLGASGAPLVAHMLCRCAAVIAYATDRQYDVGSTFAGYDIFPVLACLSEKRTFRFHVVKVSWISNTRVVHSC